MSNDYAQTLPPLPPTDYGLWRDTPYAERYISSGNDGYTEEHLEAYGHACAEHVRAPLLARIAEMEQSVETFRAARDGYRDDAFRLSADKRALLQGGQEQASEIARLHAELAAKGARVAELESLRSEAAQLSHQFRNERDQWKANHDNQVALKAALLDRPDLKERAALVQSLAAERDRLRAEVEAKAGEVEALRGFAQKVMEAWPECGVDGFELEDYAKEFGLIQSTRVKGPCGEDCACLAACADWPTDCYHRTSLLTGSGPWVNPLAAELEKLRGEGQT